jgi:hypothetical protein
MPLARRTERTLEAVGCTPLFGAVLSGLSNRFNTIVID